MGRRIMMSAVKSDVETESVEAAEAKTDKVRLERYLARALEVLSRLDAAELTAVPKSTEWLSKLASEANKLPEGWTSTAFSPTRTRPVQEGDSVLLTPDEVPLYQWLGVDGASVLTVVRLLSEPGKGRQLKVLVRFPQGQEIPMLSNQLRKA